MPLSPVEFPRFKGLSLVEDAQEIGAAQAVDLRDVLFAPSLGRVATRPGSAVVASIGSPDSFSNIAPHSNEAIIASSGSGLRAYDPSGFPLAIVGAVEDLWGYANFGTPTQTRTYLATGAAGVAVYRFDGASFTPVIAVGKWGAIAVQQSDNRLVVAGAPAEDSKVMFSDPGQPENMPSTNFVQVSPGDGQRVVALASYGNLLFAFKSTKLFVFYGTDIDGTGEPVFNYRTVDTGVGIVDQGQSSYCGLAVGPTGVYFVGRDGIYLTSGGPPQLVVSIAALTRAASMPYFTGTKTFSYPIALAYYDDRLYISHADASHSPAQTLVYDLRTQDLSAFSLGIRSYVVLSDTFALRPRLFYLSASPANQLRVFDDAATTDAGAPITGRYRTGFWNPGAPGSETDIFEWLIDGTGNITVKTAVNDAIALGAARSVALGTAPQVAQGRDGRAVWGRNISVELSGQAPWSISRVIANVSSQTDPGFKRP